MTKSECNQWVKNKKENPNNPINPASGRRVKKGGPTYNEIEKQCFGVVIKTVRKKGRGNENFTKEECEEWLENKKKEPNNPVNPRSGRKVKKGKGVYNKLERECEERGLVVVRSVSPRKRRTSLRPTEVVLSRNLAVKVGLQIDLNNVKLCLDKLSRRTFSVESIIVLTAYIEYMIAEILELAGNITYDDGRVDITYDDVANAVNQDEELRKLYTGKLVKKNLCLKNIKNIGKQVHTELFLSKGAEIYVDNMIEDFIKRLINEVNVSGIIDPKELEKAISNLIPNTQILKFAISQGKKALKKYKRNLE